MSQSRPNASKIPMVRRIVPVEIEITWVVCFEGIREEYHTPLSSSSLFGYAEGVFMPNYAENRKARYDYDVLESFEGGLVLTGQETKSVRGGRAKLQGSFLKLLSGQLWLIGAHIAPYEKASHLESYDPTRSRKVLVRQSELHYFAGKIQEKGLTLVPFSFYPKGRRIKVSFALCRGKKTHNKRETLKQRDLERSTRRILKGYDE